MDHVNKMPDEQKQAGGGMHALWSAIWLGFYSYFFSQAQLY